MSTPSHLPAAGALRGRRWPSRQLLLGANVIAPLGAGALALHGRWAGALGLLMAAHAAALWATLYPYSRWWGPQVGSFAPRGREVWLTLDDGPDPEDTPRLLDLLERHGARATFFLIGERMRRWPHLAAEVLRRGHGVENHTLTHPHTRFWRLGTRALAGEIDGATAAQLETTGTAPALFRAPAGMRNWRLHPLLRQRGLTLASWSVRGLDGRDTDADAIVSRILAGVRPGAIILMHEAHRAPDGSSVAARCVPRVLEHLTDEGYRLVIPSADQFRS